MNQPARGTGMSCRSSREAGKPLCSRRFGSPLEYPQLVAVTSDVSCPSIGTRVGALKLGEPKDAPDASSAERQWGASHHNWSKTMTFSRIALIAVAAVAMAPGVGPAFAADDAARIKQCVADNQGEGQTATVVAAYCSCMSNKMSDLKETHRSPPGRIPIPTSKRTAPRKRARRAPNRKSTK